MYYILFKWIKYKRLEILKNN